MWIVRKVHEWVPIFFLINICCYVTVGRGEFVKPKLAFREYTLGTTDLYPHYSVKSMDSRFDDKKRAPFYFSNSRGVLKHWTGENGS